MPEPKKVSQPIRIDAELEEKIEEAARLTGLSKADVMRLAMRIGFEDLRKINYNIAGAVSDKANPSPERVPVKYPAARDLKALPSSLNEEPKHRSR